MVTGSSEEPESYAITFTNKDADKLFGPHYEALVISLSIDNCLIKRILVDTGSYANILQLGALKEMRLDETQIIRCSVTLVGFNGNATDTVGKISPIVYVKRVNLNTRFSVLDCPSVYNVILGRLQIHEMKAVPSSYHQVVKFPIR